jgi:ectoine hydroxylase-related dioxygenase (phytanoyl-CoA dioxygenase family)
MAHYVDKTSELLKIDRQEEVIEELEADIRSESLVESGIADLSVLNLDDKTSFPMSTSPHPPMTEPTASDEQTRKPYHFRIEDEYEWRSYLKSHGYVVIKQVASLEQVSKCIGKFWDHFERKYPGVYRNDPNTWEQWPISSHGIITDGSIIHCEAAWTIRTLAKVRNIFATIWETNDLLVSFDSSIIWLPRYPHHTEGLHLDQNPFDNTIFKLSDDISQSIVQSMVPLYDVTEQSGGLEVVPESHLPSFQNHIKLHFPRFQRRSNNFCALGEEGSKLYGENAILIEAQAGDLILWDSRLLHGGKVGNQEIDCDHLVRLSQTVCMTPRKYATETVLRSRKNAVLRGIGCNHVPHEFVQTTSFSGESYIKPTLSAEQVELI